MLVSKISQLGPALSGTSRQVGIYFWVKTHLAEKETAAMRACPL